LATKQLTLVLAF